MTDSFNQRTNLYVLAVFRGNPFRKVKKAYNNCRVRLIGGQFSALQIDFSPRNNTLMRGHRHFLSALFQIKEN